MNIPSPNTESYVIFSKSGCKFCERAKEILKYNNIEHVVVDCDGYLAENKSGFLEKMKIYTNKDYRTFPMVFYKGVFLGGYVEMKSHFDTHYVPTVVSSQLKFCCEF